MRSDLLDIITNIKPDETPLYVIMLIDQGYSKKEAWKKYRAMVKSTKGQNYY